MQVEINDKLYKDIAGYCELNSIEVTEFINKILKSGYMLEKYGDRPGIQGKPTEVEIEVHKDEETKEYVVETKETEIPIEAEPKPKFQVKWNVDFEHDEGLKQAREIEKEAIEQWVANEVSKEEPKRGRKRKLS